MSLEAAFGAAEAEPDGEGLLLADLLPAPDDSPENRLLRETLMDALTDALAGFVTMHLWNWLVPTLFHGPFITLAQTYGLLLLSRILVGFRGGHGGGWAARKQAWQRRMAAKLEHLSPEEREHLRAKMARHCGPAWMRNRAATADPAPIA